jgi:membrane protease YdiL (CAAX protease family)
MQCFYKVPIKEWGCMASESGWRIFLGAVLLLVVSYVIYQLRYPLWFSLKYVELIFVMLILSYFAVFILALLLLKRDSKKSLSNLLKASGRSIVLVGVVFALLYEGIWYLMSFAIGDRFAFTSFPSLSGYESYSVYLLPLAFALQLVFVVFGSFVEEVAYRGYVQTRIMSKYGLIIGIFVAALFFSLQHIQFFVLSWIENFFQTQFLYLIFFGIFVGYLFFKSKENIWSVFSFHALLDIFNVSVPLVVTASSLVASQLVNVLSFAIIILLLHYLL